MIDFIRWILRIDGHFVRKLDSQFWAKLIDKLLQDTKLMSTLQEDLDSAKESLNQMASFRNEVLSKLSEVSDNVQKLFESTLTPQQKADLEAVSEGLKNLVESAQTIESGVDAIDSFADPKP